MNETERRTELKHFLRRRREGLRPEEVGLPAGVRRRTPGLRREEVAELAGTGVAWYSWLEMGRDIRVSTKMLDGVARALRLDEAEREYLFSLAGNAPPKRDRTEHETLHRFVRPILDGFDGAAYFVGPRLDVLAWNRQAEKLFHFVESDGFGSNLVWRMLNDPQKRLLHVNWLDDARNAVATFRTHYGQFIGDPRFETLRDELEHRSPEFRRIWPEQGVVKRMTREVLLQVPEVGHFTLQLVNFATPWDPLQTIVFSYCTSPPAIERRYRRFLRSGTAVIPE